jgi:hypothetical protein
MNRIMRVIGLFSLLAVPTWMVAQTASQGRSTLDHGELGIFGEYLRFSPGPSATNYVGVGARAAFNVHPNVAIEGQLSYDFERNYTSTYQNGASTTFVRSGVRPITGLFGPKFQVGTGGPFRLFGTAKVGFVNFGVSNTAVVSGSTFTSGVAGVGNGGNYLAVYPGGGIEAFGGPIGIRIEAGDEIYFNNGANNNIRIEFGPTLRF